MEALTPADLLDAWERGASADDHERALVLLGYARPDVSPEALGSIPIGGRDVALLHLRATTFGETMTAVTSCPSCGDQLELRLEVADLIAGEPEDTADGEGGSGSDWIVATAGEQRVRVRRPTTADLVAALEAASMVGGDPAVARHELVRRLVIDHPPSGLDEALETAIEDAVGVAESGLDMTIDVGCPACHHEWETWIDVPGFLWTEVAASARRVAGEVAGLAVAYGWRESDVLALSPWRRQLYLDLAAE